MLNNMYIQHTIQYILVYIEDIHLLRDPCLLIYVYSKLYIIQYIILYIESTNLTLRPVLTTTYIQHTI